MRFYNGTIASYQTKCIHFSLQASKSLPVKFQQKDSRRNQGLSSWTGLSGTDKKSLRSSVAQNHFNRFKSIFQKSETTHHSSATINTPIKLSPTRRSASGQGERPRWKPRVPDAPRSGMLKHIKINAHKSDRVNMIILKHKIAKELENNA